jgi:hypothetical protein
MAINANVLATAGTNIGQQIGRATEQFGQNIGGMLTDVGRGFSERRSSREAQQLLQQYANDPAQLNALGQKYATEGNDALSKVFFEAAKQATAAQAGKKTALQEKGELALFNMARMMQASPSEDISRNNLKRQNYLTTAEGYGVSPERAMQILNESVTTTKDKFKVVGNRVFNTETEQYVEPSEAAELLPLSALKDAATPESLIEYIQTGDKSVLEAVVEDEGPDEGAIKSKLLSTDNILNTVKEASGLSGEVYPVFYDVTKFLPTTNARQLSGRVETLKSALSFDRLQQMRDESKTGGALGNVSNVELGLLGANLAALDPASGDFAQQLQKVEIHYTNFKNALLGQKPVGDRYVEDEGILYYVDDKGDYVRLGKL